MATIAEQINKGVCAYSEIEGTEYSKGCITQMLKAKADWFIKPGEEFKAGETFEDELTRLITSDKLIVVRGIDTTEEVGNDDTDDTSESGVDQLTNEGLYKFQNMYRNGLYFNRANKKTLKGYRKWNTLRVTKEGIFGTKTTTGGITGFTTGKINTTKLSLGSDSQTQKEGLVYQLLERDEVDIDFAFIPNTTAWKQKGVTQVTLSYVNAPANADTTVTVKAEIAQDGEDFTGIDYTSFLNTVAGATANPTAGDDSATTGTFVLTGVTAISTNDAVTTRLYDNSNNRNVIVGADGDYYRSNLLTATAV